MTIDFKTILPEIILQKIIQKTISEFENKYLCIDYNNEAVHTGLKLKPKMLMSKIFSNVFYFFKHFKEPENPYDDYYEQQIGIDKEITEENIIEINEIEINEKLLEIYKKNEFFFNEVEKHIIIKHLKTVLLNIEEINEKNREIFNYINSCFKSLYSCNYEQYIKVLKKKIFLHYGEDTIHNYSYLKKSSINLGKIKLRHFDNPSLKKIFENNNKFYWLYLSMINDIDQIKEDNENYDLIHLKKILEKHGLSDKGWDFLQNQNQHYITRMGQSIAWSVFCVNYGLKDAWLRNNKHKYLFNRMKNMYYKSDIIDSDLKKIYLSLGKSCSKWNKPVTKFCMISSYRLKLLVRYISKNSGFAKITNQCLEDKEMNYHYSYYIDSLKSYDRYHDSFFLSQLFNEVLIYMQYHIKEIKRMPSHFILKDYIETVYSFNLENKDDFFDFDICHENLRELDPIAYQYLKKCPELLKISEGDFLFNYLELTCEKTIQRKNIYSLVVLKIFRDLIYSNKDYSIFSKYTNSINKIKEVFGESVFLLAHKDSMRRKVSIEELKLIDNDTRVINDNKLLFNDFINFIPFDGDNYLKNVKSYLSNKGMNHTSWTYMLKEYKKSKTFSFVKTITSGKNDDPHWKLKCAIDMFNHYIPVKYFKFINQYFYPYVSHYHSKIYQMHWDKINIFCSAFYHSFLSLINTCSGKGKIKNDYFFSNIISSSRNKYYVNYIKHNNQVTIKDMFQRDMQIIVDYLIRGCEGKIVSQSSLKKILEKANKWHEENFIDNLKRYEYKEEDIHSLSIDQEYTFIQIKNTEEIAREAHEMKHCIANYNEYCASNRYVAYHMTSRKGESATLGIDKSGSSYFYNQLYSFRNRPVSKEARNAAKFLVKLLNKNDINNNISLYGIAA